MFEINFVQNFTCFGHSASNSHVHDLVKSDAGLLVNEHYNVYIASYWL